MTEHKKTIRCAVYTRKSSEEGLEQSFNSLDAQREACQAYILSQRQEGWRAIQTEYDDGGYSGGTIDRPALQRLLSDIKCRKVDTVVVYKVDRLTRSLADFAKIIETLDAHQVSFVSVTQQFNTTSSMGRLTLNVLLSFAQFEREVTGERIRDKIAASKRKGMWMGGQVPLGYDLNDRHLVVNREEATLVQQIFKLYCKLGCVKRLKTHLDRQGLKTRIRTSRSERKSGGGSYSRGALYHLLKNRIYLGEVPHKGQCYPGIHEALIPQKLWEEVQNKLKENAINRRFGANATEVSVLKGLVCDADGTRYTPSHAVKNGKRYRYYTAQRIIKDADSKSEVPGRIPASDIEDLVVRKLKSFLTSPESVSRKLGLSGDDIGTTQRIVRIAQQLARKIDGSNGAALTEILSTALQKVALHATSIELHVRKNGLRSYLIGKISQQDAHTKDLGEETVVLNIAAELKRCRGEKRIVLSDREPELTTSRTVLPLVKAVTRAHEWARQLASGECKDLQAISVRTGLDQRYLSRILPLAFLVPEMIEAILDGRQHPGTTIDDLRALALLDWPEQRSRLRWLEA